MPWRWRWLGFVARLTHVMKDLIAYETWHGVMWLRWRRSRQDLARQTGCKYEGQVRGFGAMDHMVVKLKQNLASMDEGNGEKQVKSRSMNQYGHVMIWSRSYHLVIGWFMCCINNGGDGMDCARQRYNLGHFISPVKGYVEKCMTGFGIDGRTIKRGKFVCMSVI